MADVDWGQVEQQLKDKAGQWYDPSMLGDVQRNASYGAGDSPDMSSINDWVNRVSNKAQLRGSNETNSTYVANGSGGYTVGPTGTVNNPTGGSTSSTPAPQSPSQTSQAPSYESELIKQMMERQAAQDAENKARGDNLYNMLLEQAKQGLAVDRNNPVIRAQADAYSAQQERAGRNYISDAAERGGPYANIEGVRRMVAEHAGQAAGAFEANLMGQEVAAKRQEIAQALAGMGGYLTAAQQNELQRQLGLLDQSIKTQQVGLGRDTLAQEWQRALLANEQFNNQLGQTAQQQRAYYDWLWGHGA